MNFIRTIPIYGECVWGGSALEKEFGRKLPKGLKIGESWEISDRPGAESKIEGGRFDAKTLREAIRQAPEYIMGPE